MGLLGDKDERAAKKAGKQADKLAKLEEGVEQNTPKALQALQARRAWLIGGLARDTAGLTGGALDDDVEHRAQALFYVDHAIASLQGDAS